MPGAVKISEAASLAIHAMVLMAVNPEGMLSVKEIAETYHLSSAHLAKVLQRLARQGLVESSRGPAGGFRLARPASEISLLEIYEGIEESLEQPGCLLDSDICAGNACLLGDAIKRINEEVRRIFHDTSLAALARSYILGRNHTA